jgi:hypothetical protein
MTISKALRLLASPTRLSAYLRLRRERRDRYLTLCKVTRLESAQRLADKIREIDRQMAEL